MLIQIIFFSAVALLVIVLLFRYSSGATVAQENQLNKYLKIFLQKITVATRSITQLFARKETISINEPSSHEFWRDEVKNSAPIVSTHFEEAENKYKQGDYEAAERLYLKAASTHPDDPKVYAKLGRLYLEQKNFSDAIEALKLAAKLDKHNPSRHYNLALAYYGNKDIRKAIASVREAIGLDPITPKYRALLEQLLEGQAKGSDIDASK